MNEFLKKYGLSGNTLKIIAALSMLIDHIGVALFPNVAILRILGRIAFPIFAFMIAEGCTYTKNKLRYFLTIFLLGAVYQLVYYLYNGSTYMGILITFSLSILMIYALQNLKNAFYAAQKRCLNVCIAISLFIFAVVGVYFLNKTFTIDYGFWGCMAPVFASFLRKPKMSKSTVWEKIDNNFLHVLMLGIGLIFLISQYNGHQAYSLIALLFLLLYSGKKGKLKMKYFFYIFYPVHLLVIAFISYLIASLT